MLALSIGPIAHTPKRQPKVFSIVPQAARATCIHTTQHTIISLGFYRSALDWAAGMERDALESAAMCHGLDGVEAQSLALLKLNEEGSRIEWRARDGAREKAGGCLGDGDAHPAAQGGAVGQCRCIQYIGSRVRVLFCSNTFYTRFSAPADKSWRTPSLPETSQLSMCWTIRPLSASKTCFTPHGHASTGDHGSPKRSFTISFVV